MKKVCILSLVAIALISGAAVAEQMLPYAADEYYASAAVQSDGSLYSWGYQFNDIVSNTVPAGNDFRYVTCANNTAVAVRSDGSLAAWGDNSSLQISNCPTGSGYTFVTGGRKTFAAINSSGQLTVWGDDTGNLVSGAPSGTFKDIAIGGDYAVAIKTDGSVVSWGSAIGSYSQLQSNPSGTDFEDVEIYGSITPFFLKSDNTIMKWTTYTSYAEEPSAGENHDFVSLQAGGHAIIGIREDDSVYASGHSSFSAVTECPSELTSVNSMYHGLGVLPDNTMTGWGQNNYGEATIPEDLHVWGTNVPEPATVSLLLLGGIAMAIKKRRG